jgi:hypothetical protein
MHSPSDSKRGVAARRVFTSYFKEVEYREELDI